MRTLMKFGCDWRKISRKGKCRKDSESTLVYHFVHISSISIHVHAQHNSVEYPYTIAELYNLPSFEEGHSTSGGVNHDDTALL